MQGHGTAGQKIRVPPRIPAAKTFCAGDPRASQSRDFHIDQVRVMACFPQGREKQLRSHGLAFTVPPQADGKWGQISVPSSPVPAHTLCGGMRSEPIGSHSHHFKSLRASPLCC